MKGYVDENFRKNGTEIRTLDDKVERVREEGSEEVKAKVGEVRGEAERRADGLRQCMVGLGESLKGFVGSVEERHVALGAAVGKRLKAMDRDTKKREAELRAELEGVRERGEEERARLGEKMDADHGVLTGAMLELSKKIGEAMKVQAANERAKFDQTNQAVAEQAQGLRRLEEAWAKGLAATQEHLDRTDKALVAAMDGVKTAFDAGLDEARIQHKAELAARLGVVLVGMNSLSDQIGQVATDATRHSDEIKGELGSALQELSTHVEARTNDLETRAAEAVTTLSGTLAQTKAELDAQALKNHQHSLESVDRLQQAIDALQRLQTDTVAQFQAFQADTLPTLETKERLQSFLSAINSKYDGRLATLDKDLKDIAVKGETIDMGIDQVRADFDGIKKCIDAFVIDKENLDANVQEALTDTRALVKELERIKGQVERMEETADLAYGELKEKVQAARGEMLTGLQALTGVVGGLEEGLGGVRERAEAAIKGVEFKVDEAAGLAKQAGARTEELNKVRSEELKRLEESGVRDLVAKADALERQLGERQAELKDLATKVEDNKAAVGAQIANLNKAQADLTKQLELMNIKGRDTLVEKKESLRAPAPTPDPSKEALEKEVAAVKSDLEGIKQMLNGIDENMGSKSQQIGDTLARLDGEIKALSQKAEAGQGQGQAPAGGVLQLPAETANELRSLREDVEWAKTMAANIDENLGERKAQVMARFQEIFEDSQAMAAKIQALESRLGGPVPQGGDQGASDQEPAHSYISPVGLLPDAQILPVITAQLQPVHTALAKVQADVAGKESEASIQEQMRQAKDAKLAEDVADLGAKLQGLREEVKANLDRYQKELAARFDTKMRSHRDDLHSEIAENVQTLVEDAVAAVSQKNLGSGGNLTPRGRPSTDLKRGATQGSQARGSKQETEPPKRRSDMENELSLAKIGKLEAKVGEWEAKLARLEDRLGKGTTPDGGATRRSGLTEAASNSRSNLERKGTGSSGSKPEVDQASALKAQVQTAIRDMDEDALKALRERLQKDSPTGLLAPAPTLPGFEPQASITGVEEKLKRDLDSFKAEVGVMIKNLQHKFMDGGRSKSRVRAGPASQNSLQMEGIASVNRFDSDEIMDHGNSLGMDDVEPSEGRPIQVTTEGQEGKKSNVEATRGTRQAIDSNNDFLGGSNFGRHESSLELEKLPGKPEGEVARQVPKVSPMGEGLKKLPTKLISSYGMNELEKQMAMIGVTAQERLEAKEREMTQAFTTMLNDATASLKGTLEDTIGRKVAQLRQELGVKAEDGKISSSGSENDSGLEKDLGRNKAPAQTDPQNTLTPTLTAEIDAKTKAACQAEVEKLANELRAELAQKLQTSPKIDSKSGRASSRPSQTGPLLRQGSSVSNDPFLALKRTENLVDERISKAVGALEAKMEQILKDIKSQMNLDESGSHSILKGEDIIRLENLLKSGSLKALDKKAGNAEMSRMNSIAAVVEKKMQFLENRIDDKLKRFEAEVSKMETIKKEMMKGVDLENNRMRMFVQNENDNLLEKVTETLRRQSVLSPEIVAEARRASKAEQGSTLNS